MSEATAQAPATTENTSRATPDTEASATTTVPGAPAAGAPPAATTTATVSLTPEQLAATVKREAMLRETRARLKTLETVAKEAEPVLAAKRLYAEGKHLEALRVLSGADPSEEVTKVLDSFLAAGAGAGQETVEQRLARLESERAADAAAREKTEADARAAAATEYAFGVATKNADKYELCARPENKEDATKRALAGVIALASERELDLESLDEAATEKLFVEAYAAVEKELETEGVKALELAQKRFAKAQAGKPATAGATAPKPAPVGSPERAGVTPLGSYAGVKSTADASRLLEERLKAAISQA